MGNTTGITRGRGIGLSQSSMCSFKYSLHMGLNSERESPTNAYVTRSATK